MTPDQRLDSQVKTRLQAWPQRPPGLLGMKRAGRWLKARPGTDLGSNPPFLKLPGSDRLRTMPDGLWLEFGGSPSEGYVDVLALEACGCKANLFDKRSRFAPSTQSLMVVCPLAWLLAPVMPGHGTSRWELTGVLPHRPFAPLILPVRDMRVVYALKLRDYSGFVSHQVPHAHEYFVPMEALVAKNSDENPALQALFRRASPSANFLEFS